MCRFWTNNRNGYCLADTCKDVEGDIVHLLAICPALDHTRHRLHSLWCTKTVNCPPLHSLVLRILGSPPDTLTKFVLDCTAFPEIIQLRQILGKGLEDMVLYLTRTWAYAIHRQKMILLGRWPGTTMDNEKQRVNTTTTIITMPAPPTPIPRSNPINTQFSLI